MGTDTPMHIDRGYLADNSSDEDENEFSSTSASTMDNKHHSSTEATPLLLPAPPRLASYISLKLPHLPVKPLSYKPLLSLLIVIVILSSSSDEIMESAQLRIFESIICYRHYESTDPTKLLLGRSAVGPGAIGGVLEQDCKIDGVQGELAMLVGYTRFFNGLPSLLLAVPFGWAADRYGRRPFLVLGMVSFVLKIGWVQVVSWFWQAFDIKMIWLGTVPMLLSGGETVVTGLLFVVLSDIVPEADRTSVFLITGACSLLASLLMPLLGALLMEENPWIPALLGLLLAILPLFGLIFVPETLHRRHLYSPQISPPPSPSAPQPPASSTHPPAITPPLHHRLAAQLRNSTSFLTHDARVPLLILPFFGHTLITTASQLLLQYMSKRYAITFSTATILKTTFNAVKVVLLFLILPTASKLGTHYLHLSTQRKDLYLARGSQALLAVGYLLVGISPNIPTVVASMILASLGMGLYLMIRSFLTSLVPSHHIARVYSIITLLETLGGMFGGALTAALFKAGLRLGGGWIGLPWLFVGGVGCVCTGLLFAVRLRLEEDEGGDAGSEVDVM
ncbi:hypothetical protein LTR62_004576 [Meristemomyces frigidus]|uniref:Major facilitator superfamily (MFS) profile domain-containing protein n=1 Tax=Meristemomyces frigidus TaxID=1508187 RepID=A0AAN7YP43_9PEZI|nr:hypothetical protein LTR62_004576 [Meristemomyces frigidus]